MTEEGLSRALGGMLQQLMTQLQADAAARTPVGAATSTATPTQAKLMHKQFAKVEKMSSAADWKEWHFQFLVATKSQSMAVGEAMERVEQLTLDEVTYQNILADPNIDPAIAATIDRSKGELYSVLTLWTKGEPNQIVRNVLDSNCYVAWMRLHDRYNPRPPASMAAAWREVRKTKKCATYVRRRRS